MLKRKMGLSFLTFLIITGLAGAIHNSSISRLERRTAIGLFKETKSEFITSTKNLSDEQLNFKTTNDLFTIGDYLNKIINCEKKIWMLFTESMKQPANPERRNEIKLKDTEIIDRYVGNKNQYDELFSDNNETITITKLSDAILVFNAIHGKYLKYMKSTTEDLRNHYAFTVLGWVDSYQLCLIMNAQCMQYINRLNEIKNDFRFPN